MEDFDRNIESAPAASGPAEPQPEPRRRSGAGMFLLGIGAAIVLLIGLAIVVAVFAFAFRADSGSLNLSTSKVAILPIEGEILDARETVEALHRYADNVMVRAIVVRINSPGGAIAPSQEIYEEIRKARARTKKPIVASLDSVAASGGFYIAVACDEIVANPGSITGSIGVVLQWLDVGNLLKWAHMRPETITSGELKAAGSPYRPLTDSERAYFQRIVDQLHGQFVKAVASGRKGKISEDDVRRVADGRVFTGEEAHALHLVDRLGTLHDAVAIAGRLGGIKGEPSTIYPRRRRVGLLDLLTDNGDAESLINRVISRRSSVFFYRW